MLALEPGGAGKNGGPDRVGAEAAADGVDGAVGLLPTGRGQVVQAQLATRAGREPAHAHAEKPDARARVDAREQRLRGPDDGRRGVDRRGQGRGAGDRPEVVEAHLYRYGPAGQIVCAEPGGDGVPHPYGLALEAGEGVVVLGERLLVANGLERLVRDDRPVVDAVGELVEMTAVGIAQGAGDGPAGEIGEVADRPDAVALEAGGTGRPDSPQRADR